MLLLALQATYQSELIEETPVYPRVCGKGNYHYEAIQIEIQHSGSYTFNANSTIKLYGYIYRGDFDPSYPNTDIITQSNFSCGSSFKVGNYLEANKVYTLIVTTFDPNVRGPFTLFIIGPTNITFNRISK